MSATSARFNLDEIRSDFIAQQDEAGLYIIYEIRHSLRRIEELRELIRSRAEVLQSDLDRLIDSAANNPEGVPGWTNQLSNEGENLQNLGRELRWELKSLSGGWERLGLYLKRVGHPAAPSA